jgi:hypothetical protein
MRYLMAMLEKLLFRRPKLAVNADLWRHGIAELRKRSANVRESGAFLLGRYDNGCRVIEEFVFYDDIDPGCAAAGYIHFDGRKLGLVWKRCRETGRALVADVHTHPGGYGQSSIDKENPMHPHKGHIGLIVPYYALRDSAPGKIGIYEYMGGFAWKSHSARGRAVMRVLENG